jgi:hypothetical protein
MKIIEVPVFDDNGGLQYTAVVSPEEAKDLLQFALNFAQVIRRNTQINTFSDEINVELND